MNDRVPPHDPETEQAVLGAILTRDRALEQAVDELTEDDFYVPEHAKLFARIAQVHDDGMKPDALTLGVPQKRIGELQAANPISSHVGSWASKLRDLSACRRAIALAERLAEDAYAADVEAVHQLLQGADVTVAADSFHVEPPIEASILAEEDHRPDWVIRDLIARWEVALFVAEPGAGKTTLLNQIAACYASGIHPWLRYDIPPGIAVVFDCQDSRGARGRSVQWLLQIAGDRYRKTLFYELKAEGIDLTQRRDQRWFEAKVASVNADLVIAGPLYNMVRGAPMRSKQSEETAELAGSFLSRMVVRQNCSLLIEAHAPHGDDIRVRGSKYWEDWAAFGFGLEDQTNDVDGRRFKVKRFRYDRETGRRWPNEYVQGRPGEWPWEGLHIPGGRDDGMTEPMGGGAF